MRRLLSIPIDQNGRLNRNITRELILVRKPSTTPITLPDEPPTAAVANSWILYEDPLERFHFRHPQELQLPGDASGNPDLIELVNKKSNATDVLIIGFQPKEADQAKNRRALDMSEHIRGLREIWAKTNQEVVEGEVLELPNQGDAHRNRRVVRFEAALKPAEQRASRIYYNYYLILFATDSFVVTAFTERNDHLVFRKQIEDVIDSLEFGPKQGSAAKPAGRPAPPAPGAQLRHPGPHRSFLAPHRPFLTLHP